ncbi:hypothetical protein J422_01760 [Methanocaldococcus villosus KIN24-T80]|uniref:Uncharacterized protein n=1 Tax=Methanocaldococcus villosus KIN24-T80 TaxID=1069083 RepID=N6VRJ8_9EURY|nr:zinc ribbon domain-containing protein [Methanocaldococcus villosus]ENN96505.1 hypothetical protein J422_01760 [Methanocaldococcus villosus KIN24-T80]
MGKVVPLTDEEKMSIVSGLRSSVPATRLVTLRRLQDLASRKPETILYLDAYDKVTLNEILTLLNHIAEYDPDEILRREAVITMEAVKKALGFKFSEVIPTCTNCGNPIDVGWDYCVNCGAEIDKMELEDIKRCPNCNKYIFETWKFCAHCKYKLREEEEVITRCPRCKRPVDPEWLVCPYCGYRLKRVNK